jgi:predicted SAM-dependent methyltransferase
LPVNRHVFDHIRGELNAIWVRTLHLAHPLYRIRIRRLRKQRNILLNLGCGPFGKEGWVNLDLFKLDRVSLRTDCRKDLPIGDGACAGIHVEHYFEHLTHEEEAPKFLQECKRCLAAGAILRIIVPDVESFARAYADDGWESLESLAAEGSSMKANFATKMDALSHVMVQQHEHFGGYDFDTLALALRRAGFRDIQRCKFQEGRFPGGCIDRDQHKPYSLYVEAAN